LEFEDYSFDEHFQRPIASYPPRAVLWDYIKGRVEKAGVREQIRFNSPCRNVTYDAATELFSVTLHDHNKDNIHTEVFDHVAGNTVTFTDGTTQDVDAIILCTGYTHFFPFMEDSLRLDCDNRLWVQPLYKGVLWMNNPKLVYLGMQDQFYTFNMFDAQAWYARDVIMGRIDTPDRATMEADSNVWLAREEKLETDSDMIWYHSDYTQDLIDATGYPNFDIAGVNRTFEEWEGHKHNDIMGFRNKSFRSLIAGTQSPPHHTPWLEALDDSLEAYLDI
jgi:trimethylamine monooxygenase